MKSVKRRLNKILQKTGIVARTTPYSCSVCNSNNIHFNPLAEKYHRQYNNAGFKHSIYLFETLNLFDYSCSDRKSVV